MGLASEQPDGVAGWPFYGPNQRNKSHSISTFIVVGEPEDVTKSLLNAFLESFSSVDVCEESLVHVK